VTRGRLKRRGVGTEGWVCAALCSWREERKLRRLVGPWGAAYRTTRHERRLFDFRHERRLFDFRHERRLFDFRQGGGFQQIPIPYRLEKISSIPRVVKTTTVIRSEKTHILVVKEIEHVD